MYRYWMKKMKFICLAIVVFGTTLLGTSFQTFAAGAGININIAVKSAILIETSTGKILYQNNPDIPLPPASMTKMMTEYLVLEAVKNKKIQWDEQVPVSEYAFFIAQMSDSAGVYLNMGETHPVKELYKAMAIASANDATVLLAEKVGGTEENFVTMMNQKAQQLGMKNTFYVTSTGLPANELQQFKPANAEGKDNAMSARDAAILARALIRDFPDSLEYSKIPRYVFREGQANPIKKANYNWMLPGLPAEYAGVDGLKTGYTAEARYCFTGTALRDGMRLVSVVMGTETELKRFAETKKLFDYGFSNYKLTKKIDKGAPVSGFEQAQVKQGVELTVPAVTGDIVNVVSRVGEEGKFKPVVTFHELTAPIKKDQPIGKITLTGEKDLGYLQPEDAKKGGVDMVAAQDVEEASWIRLFFRSVIEFIKNLF